MVHEKLSLFEACGLGWITASLLLGCSQQGSIQEDGFREQRQADSVTVEAPTVKKEEAVEKEEAVVAPQNVEALLNAATAESSAAEQEYQAAVAKARADGTAQQMRAEFEATPEGEFSKRQMMVLVLGDVGGDEEIPLLLSLAVADPGLLDPIEVAIKTEVQPETEEEHEETYDRISQYSERFMLRRVAVSSLASMARQGSEEAAEALGRVIVDAVDPAMAQTAAYQLSELGRLSKAHKATLRKRGIPHGFRKLDTEKLMQLPVIDRATTPTPPVGE